MPHAGPVTHWLSGTPPPWTPVSVPVPTCEVAVSHSSDLRQYDKLQVSPSTRLAKHTASRDTARVQTSLGGSNSLCSPSGLTAGCWSRRLRRHTDASGYCAKPRPPTRAGDTVRGRVFSGWSLSCWGAPLRQQAFPLAAPAASSNGDDSISGRGPRFRNGAPTAVIQAVDRPSSDLRVFGLDWNADREWRLKHISVRYCQEPTPRDHAGGTTAPSGMPDSGVFSDRCP